MKNLFLLLSLIFVSSCATKYIIPGNRFITPESQGGALRGQIEYQQTGANQLKIDTTDGTIDNGVKYDQVTRAGFLLSNSFFDSFDVIWSHTGGANSMLGGKLQILGASRSSNGAGHKLSLVALFGNNEHETDDESIEFTLGGKEFMAIYGYRISENVLPYVSVSKASYDFDGKIRSSTPSLNGAKPSLSTDSIGLSGGFEFALNSFFAKLEGTYQKLKTTDTKDRDRFTFGYSIGYSW